VTSESGHAGGASFADWFAVLRGSHQCRAATVKCPKA
jgi:hypothetical protein